MLFLGYQGLEELAPVAILGGVATTIRAFRQMSTSPLATFQFQDLHD